MKTVFAPGVPWPYTQDGVHTSAPMRRPSGPPPGATARVAEFMKEHGPCCADQMRAAGVSRNISFLRKTLREMRDLEQIVEVPGTNPGHHSTRYYQLKGVQ